MLLRTARHGVPPSITLDFLVPTPLLRPTRLRTSSKISSHASYSANAAQTPQPSSSSVSTPGNVLTHLDKEFRVFESQPLATLTNTQIKLFNNAFPELRGALNRHDIDKVSEVWSRFRQRKVLALFGPLQYDICSRLVQGYCQRVSKRRHLTDEEQSILEDIALFTAVGGATDGLRTLMLLAVEHDHPRHALALYGQYLEGLRDKGLLQDIDVECKGAQALVSDEATSTTPSPSPSPVRDEVLLSAVAAYAQLDAFAEALPTYLSAATRIAHSTLEEFLLLVPGDLQGKVEDYALRLGTASLVSRPEALSKHLANLTRDSATHSLERLYSTTIAGAREPDPWLAVKPSDVAGTRVVLLPHFFWSSFLKSFLSCRRTDLAERLWDDMLMLGVVPEIATWNTLLDGYARNRAVDSVLSTWEIMLSQGIKPDALSYRALIHGLYHAARYEEGQKHFEAFEREFVKPETACHDSAILSVYNTIVYDLLFASHHDKAMAVLEKMDARGPKPDIVTINTFLRYHARKRDLKAMAKLLQQLERRNVKPDIYTFSTLLSAMLRVRPDADRMMIDFMKRNGVPPDTTSLTAVIDSQLRERTPESFKVAMDMLSKMERNEYENAEPNAVTYTCVLTAINQGNWLDRSVVKDQSRRIWEKMRDRGIAPQRATYNILIKAALENPGQDGVENAMAYYRDMLKERVHMGNDTWYILLRGLMDRQQWGLADEVAKDMRKMKVYNPPRRF